VSDFVRNRFDDRILDREDDGSAFERFVDELLRLDAPEKNLVRGLARGADGAIDLADADHKIKHIVECKFIGADTKSTAKERWNEVKRRLENNLAQLARGDEKRRRKYRPWLKSEGELETYAFITSSICESTDERNQLHEEISNFFEKLSHDHGELSHLKNVEVDLRYWDDLVGQSARFAPLFYRWFGGFPQGYGEIGLSFGSSAGFKQFLASKNLPYFSRDSYLSENMQNDISQFDATLKFLTEGNDARAHVIFGPGGVGKTRLSIELCEKARKAGWWPVRLERNASVSKLDSLCQSHADASKLLLFIDYAEAFEELDGLPEAVARLASDGMHRISILASTRSSSLQKVADRLIELQPQTTDLSPMMHQDGFIDWLTKKIIQHFDIPQAEVIAKSCKGLPVMAAFAGFLFQKDRDQFDLQFGNLGAVNDFAGWSAKRLKAIEDRFANQPVQSLLAELAVRLPMPQAEVFAIRGVPGLKRDLFDIMKVDRWIEAESDGFGAAHDVLADAILARFLFAIPTAEQDRMQDIALLALLDDRLDRCIAAFDRLGDHPSFGRLSGKALVEFIMARDKDRTHAALPNLIKSRLFDPKELIRLLASSEDIRMWLADTPDTHIILARTGEWAASKGLGIVERATAELALCGPLDSAVAFGHHSNMVLCCAHAFDPPRFHEKVLEQLRKAPVAVNSHYLLVSLLKWGVSADDVLLHVVKWFVENSKSTKASFVYNAWLDASGEVEAVSAKLLEWVEEHGTTPEARFVYKAWLDASGEVEAVSAKLLEWVEEHGTTPDSQFVYNAWLDASGEVEAVSAKLLEWVEEHGTTPDADFVYTAWLGAKLPYEEIQLQCEAWFLTNWKLESAVFVSKALSSQPDLSLEIAARIAAWAGLYAQNEDAIFRLSRVGRLLGDMTMRRGFLKVFMESTWVVFEQLLSKPTLPEHEQNACAILFGNLVTNKNTLGADWSTVLGLFCSCLRHGNSIQPFLGVPKGTWVLLLHDAAEAGLLNPIEDRVAILHAHKLIQDSITADDYASLLHQGYLSAPAK